MVWLQENALPVLMLVMLLALMLRASIMARVTGVESVSVSELSALLASDGPPLLLDVRTQAEFRAGHLARAVSVPLSELRQRVEEVRRQAASRSIAIMCRSGSRSLSASILLKQAGFAHVLNVSGGLSRWRAQGYPMN